MLRNKIHRYLKHGTFTQLSVFEAVARLGSFTRAAAELHMAQPTVSVQIRKLGETVGLPLFERAGRSIRLTDAGHLLVDACREIFATLSRVEDSCLQLRAHDIRLRTAREANVGRLTLDAQGK